MPSVRRRQAVVPADDGLALPRPPGVFRRFWARHPLLTDILVAALALLVSLTPALTFGGGTTAGGSAAWSPLHAVTVAAGVLLVWRRRWPVAVFAAAIASAVAEMAAPPVSSGVLVLVAAYSLAVHRSTRAAWIGLGAGIGALILCAVGLAAAGVVPSSEATDTVTGAAVLGLVGTLIGINVGNRKRYLEAIIDRSRQLLVERDQQAQLAAAAERARIARELHDVVAHSLTVIVALSEGAAATKDPERAREAMDATATTARAALTEMRATLGVLREGGPDVPLTPLEPIAPEDVVAAAQRAGFPVTLAVVGRPDVPQQVRYAIGRMVQEGVTNAMRHAPQATAIRARVDYASRPVVVEVWNDGVWGEPRGDGFGLRGLHERAAHVGGTVTSAPDGRGGWALRAELPVDAPPPTAPVDVPVPTPAVAPAVPEDIEAETSRATPA